MLKGKELGAAIKQALADNGRTAADAARHFSVKPPSVSGWISTGRISKENFDRLRAWLDKTPDSHWGAHTQPVSTRMLHESTGDRYLHFDLLDVEASCGMGTISTDHQEVVERLEVLESWAVANLGGVGGDLSRIKLITAKGTSMQGSIEHGDVLFVDTDVRTFDGDGIYAIASSDGVRAKRLQKLHGDVLAIISDNRLFEPEKLTGEAINDLIICGRVLAAWTLKRFW